MIKNQESRRRMGAQIAALRAELGITQQELGERAGIKQPHIARIEKGAYSVGLDTLDTIATCLQAYGKDFIFTQDEVKEIINKEDKK